MAHICFYSTKQYDQESFNQTNTSFGHKITFVEQTFDKMTALLAQGCDIVCLFVQDYVDAECMHALATMGIRCIALRCAGFDNIDLDAAKAHNIAVVRVSAYSPYAVAEFALALILGLNRHLITATNRTRSHNFSIQGLIGCDLHGKTIGIIGTGKIGCLLAKACVGLGMHVIAYDFYPNQAQAATIDFTYTDLASIYTQSDIISLHCPLTPETQHCINTQTIASMKDGVMIINTGRGMLIDTQALIAGLESKKIGSAGLDVYEYEQGVFFNDCSVSSIQDTVLTKLLTFENVIQTSHQAFFTQEALEAIASVTLTNITDIYTGRTCPNSVSC